LHDLPQELCDEIYKYTFDFKHEVSMRKPLIQEIAYFTNWSKIDCVLHHVCRHSFQHADKLLEQEVKRYLRNPTSHLKDPSLPNSISASYFCILTDFRRSKIEEFARLTQDVIFIERLSSEPCECRRLCSCVGTRNAPNPEAWYHALCLMPKLKTFSFKIAYRETDQKNIHIVAICIGKRLLEEKRIEAVCLVSPKHIGPAVRYFSVERQFDKIVNAGSHPAYWDWTDHRTRVHRRE
jgi:hypothetical protein